MEGLEAGRTEKSLYLVAWLRLHGAVETTRLVALIHS